MNAMTMQRKELEGLAKGLAMGLKPTLKALADESSDVLELIQDLQDRIAEIERRLDSKQ